MRLRTTLVLVTLFTLFAGSAFAQPRAYVPNNGNTSNPDNTVSVVDTGTNMVIDTITVGNRPVSAVVSPDGTRAYVVNQGPDTVSVIQTSTNTVISTIDVDNDPTDIAISPDGSTVWVANFNGIPSNFGTVSKIDTATEMVTRIELPVISRSCNPNAIVVHPTLDFVYVTTACDRILAINTTTNMVIGAPNRTVLLGSSDIDINTDGTKIYVTDRGNDAVYVINLAAGLPPAAVSDTISLTDGLCAADPLDVAVSPAGNFAWVATQPTNQVSGGCNTMPPPFFANINYVRIDTGSNTAAFFTGDPLETQSTLGFLRDGTSFYGLRITGSATEVMVSPMGMITIGTPFGGFGSIPASSSPYFIGPPMSELSVTKTGNGDGNVISANPAGMNCDSTASEICDIAVPDGMEVTLTATADGSSVFNGWGMDCSGAGTSTMITVSADSECTAEFIAQQFNVDVSINPPGGGSVTSSPSGISCPSDCSELFDINTFINLNETADPDFDFVNWTGDPDCSDGDIDDLIEDTSCTANFDIKRFTVTVEIAGDGVGSVASVPAGINCPGDCSEEYIIHTMVNLNETTDPDSDFLGWTGPADCADGIIQDLTEDITCTATFNLKRFSLNINLAGDGNGTVTTTPPGISCPGDCDELFPIHTMINLNEMPNMDSDFISWTGDPDCTDGIIQDITTNTTCTATFNLKRFTLAVNLTGAGVGVVTSVPPGIDCGVDCDNIYIYGTVVNLNTLADPVSVFTGFSGDPDCSDGEVTMLSDISCDANFDFLPLILNKIFPGIASNFNNISAEVATPGGKVAFIWGYQLGATTINGQTCNGITLGIKNPQLLSIVDADLDQTANYEFYIPLIGDFEIPILTQAVDIPTCRLSDVEVNIIRKL